MADDDEHSADKFSAMFRLAPTSVITHLPVMFTRPLLPLLLIVSLTIVGPSAEAKTRSEEIADMKRIYGDIDSDASLPAQELEIGVGDTRATLKRLEMIAFEREGNLMGVSGKAALLCQDGRVIGVALRLREKLSQAPFKQRLAHFGTLMGRDDDSLLAKGLRRIAPGVSTANIFRVDDYTVAYLYEGSTMFIIRVPELENAIENN